MFTDQHNPGLQGEQFTSIVGFTQRRSQLNTNNQKKRVMDMRTGSTSKTVEKPLTAREEEILRLIGEGKISKEIAAILQIGLATIAHHRKSLCRKLDVHSTVELACKGAIYRQSAQHPTITVRLIERGTVIDVRPSGSSQS
jgi:DNA-binding CsgD family transcriptional regulator